MADLAAGLSEDEAGRGRWRVMGRKANSRPPHGRNAPPRRASARPTSSSPWRDHLGGGWRLFTRRKGVSLTTYDVMGAATARIYVLATASEGHRPPARPDAQAGPPATGPWRKAPWAWAPPDLCAGPTAKTDEGAALGSTGRQWRGGGAGGGVGHPCTSVTCAEGDR